MNTEVLYKNIGLDYDKSLLGCVMPVYLLYPGIEKYEYIEDEEYFLPKVKKYFEKIDINNLKEGDLIIFSVKKWFHFCIYAGKGLIFHCTEEGKLRLSKLSLYSKFVKYCFRYKGK